MMPDIKNCLRGRMEKTRRRVYSIAPGYARVYIYSLARVIRIYSYIYTYIRIYTWLLGEEKVVSSRARDVDLNIGLEFFDTIYCREGYIKSHYI